MAERWGIDRAQWARHAQQARQLRPRFEQMRDTLWPAVFARPAEATRPDVDEDLYGGFIGNEDRRTLDRLRAAGAAHPAREPRFTDPRLEELLLHWRARNFPQALTPEENAQWQARCRGRLLSGAGGATTLAQFQERLDTLAADADERGLALLAALHDWAEAIAP